MAAAAGMVTMAMPAQLARMRAGASTSGSVDGARLHAPGDSRTAMGRVLSVGGVGCAGRAVAMTARPISIRRRRLREGRRRRRVIGNARGGSDRTELQEVDGAWLVGVPATKFRTASARLTPSHPPASKTHQLTHSHCAFFYPSVIPCPVLPAGLSIPPPLPFHHPYFSPFPVFLGRVGTWAFDQGGRVGRAWDPALLRRHARPARGGRDRSHALGLHQVHLHLARAHRFAFAAVGMTRISRGGMWAEQTVRGAREMNVRHLNVCFWPRCASPCARCPSCLVKRF